ncbi:MAG: GNAT family N-acetyltransferase [Acidobacteriota bacterium]
MTEKPTVRDALPGDAEAVLATTLAAYAQFAESMKAEDFDLYRRHIESTLRKVAESVEAGDGSLEQLVAVRAEDVVGTVLLYPPGSDTYKTEDSKVGNYPEVRLLAVPPASRGLGVGSALMDECVARARRSGARQLGLHTMAPMAAARHIYERMGFRALPELDFQPFEDLAAEAFVLDLQR